MLTRDQVLAACIKYGPGLKTPAKISGPRLMAAFAAVESSLGINIGPRHEPAYDVDGSVWKRSVAQRMIVHHFGSAAASSYGPWQMMFDNFTDVDGNLDKLNNLDFLAQEFVHWFNHWVIDFRKAASLEQCGEVWNTGRIQPDPSYVAKLQLAYLKSAAWGIQ